MPTRSLMQSDAFLLALGLLCPGLVSLLLVVDCAHFGVPPLLQSSICADFSALVLDLATLEISLLIRSSEYAGPLSTVFGLTCLGSVFMLPATDYALVESLVLLKSLGRIGVLILILDLVKLESPFLLHGVAKPEFSLSSSIVAP